jgi:hypothetical protein
MRAKHRTGWLCFQHITGIANAYSTIAALSTGSYWFALISGACTVLVAAWRIAPPPANKDKP